ncbi:MAG TPA: hydroxymethylglutaryl-CoA reductase [Solirubrobacteraceae bacterium]|nr:hydroxymethylglutaryl-CoA reductase [Solirubrobacteraceae bacterium]
MDTGSDAGRVKIPRDPQNDYTRQAAEGRATFIAGQTGVELQHLVSYSLDPATLPGNVENFVGVAQVPIGLAGPLLVNGEHAQGEFYVPLATTEGTLVASYNRGMKLARAAGGVTVTVMHDAMQRAPAFVFDSAREARTFGRWLTAHFDEVKREADATTGSGRLRDIQQFPAGRMLFTRFNYTTGDAAGQNMTSKATAFACKWITAQRREIRHFILESNFATDKKSSQVNMLHTRGKRVVAELTLPGDLVRAQMHVDPEQLFHTRLVSNLGAFMSGANNNGAQAANGISAIFIATGQDVANVAESCAAYGYSELLPNGDYYGSVTLPALIVATYGGGTGLATQRECLELLDCYGTGKVMKLTEIIAATVLCGELSLGWAIAVDEWVSAHDRLGRNRPDERDEP